MQGLISTLFTHERRALAEALQRDACRELVRAETDPKWADWHKHNARLARRLLDLIDPPAGNEQAMPSPQQSLVLAHGEDPARHMRGKACLRRV